MTRKALYVTLASEGTGQGCKARGSLPSSPMACAERMWCVAGDMLPGAAYLCARAADIDRAGAAPQGKPLQAAQPGAGGLCSQAAWRHRVADACLVRLPQSPQGQLDVHCANLSSS